MNEWEKTETGWRQERASGVIVIVRDASYMFYGHLSSEPGVTGTGKSDSHAKELADSIEWAP